MWGNLPHIPPTFQIPPDFFNDTPVAVPRQGKMLSSAL